MNTKLLVATVALVIGGSMLSGCAVYTPAPYGYRPGVVVEAPPVVVAPYYGYGHWRRW